MNTSPLIAKYLIGAAAATAFAANSFAAFERTIEAPGGIGNVVALTNAIAELNALADGDTLNSRIWLQPGFYDLRGTHMTSTAHLNIEHARNLIFAGLGNGPEDTVLLGGGEAENCRVIKASGGGNYWWNTYSNLTVTGGYSTGGGGAGISGGSQGTLYTHCIISNNISTSTDRWGGGGGGCQNGCARKCLFVGNSAGYFGGALSCGGFKASMPLHPFVEDCVFSNNWLSASYNATDGGGAVSGGIHRRNKFYGNSSDASYGGAISTDEGSEQPVVIDCEFYDNHAGLGGAIYHAAAITNCAFVGNRATRSWGTDGGGAVQANNSTVTFSIVGCGFTNNTAVGSTDMYGGAVQMKDGLISNCTFVCNVANASGGGLRVDPTLQTTKVVKCDFEGNSTKSTSLGGGGAVYAPGGFERCTFITNSTARYGGAVFVASASPCGDYTGCTFVRNYASSYGGAVYSAVDGATVSDSVFAGNTNKTFGTVGYRVDFRDCVITGHVTTTYLILNANLSGCTVADNVGTYIAGGVSLDHVRGDVSTLSYTNVNCVFRGNRIAANGISEKKTIVNCDYLDNANTGGNYGYIVASTDVAYNTIFSGNTIGNSKQEFRKGANPYMTNCVYSVAGSSDEDDPMASGKCSGLKKIARDKLPFTHRMAGKYPLMPRYGGALRDAGYEEPWIVSAVGEEDCYGNPRRTFNRLDIGAAECNEEPLGMTVLVK